MGGCGLGGLLSSPLSQGQAEVDIYKFTTSVPEITQKVCEISSENENILRHFLKKLPHHKTISGSTGPDKFQVCSHLYTYMTYFEQSLMFTVLCVYDTM